VHTICVPLMYAYTHKTSINCCIQNNIQPIFMPFWTSKNCCINTLGVFGCLDPFWTSGDYSLVHVARDKTLTGPACTLRLIAQKICGCMMAQFITKRSKFGKVAIYSSIHHVCQWTTYGRCVNIREGYGDNEGSRKVINL
jgi:hypothetical protein